jgi:beta-lactamase regulating signal transducer with metallopeptidase domain
MTAAFEFDRLAQTLALGGIDSLILGTLIVGFTAVLIRVFPRPGAAARFAVWFSALAAIAVFPWFGRMLRAHSSLATYAAGECPALRVSGAWADYLLIAWGLIAAAGLTRVGVGLINFYRLRKSFIRVDLSRVDAGVRETMERHGLSRKVDLCTSTRVNVPTAMGLLKPAVVIPAWLMDDLPPAELNQIVLHELAHLRRYDDWTNLAQKIVKALFFFHPAVWWIEKKISLEREMACDDVVLAESENPRAYAECLVHLAEKSVLRRGVALGQAAVGKIRQTSLRVAQILDGNRPTGARSGWKLAASLVTGFAVLSAVGVSSGPRLVAFETSESGKVATTAPHALTPMTMIAKASTARDLPAFPLQIVKAKFETHTTQRSSAQMQYRLPPRTVAAVPRGFGARPAVPSLPFVLTSLPVSSAAGAVFVVVEQDEYQRVGQELYRISVWHLVVLHPSADSASGISRKET